MTNTLIEGIERRFTELVEVGEQLFAQIKGTHSVDVDDRSECLSWLLSAVNLLEIAMPVDSRYRREAQRLLPASHSPIFRELMATILGILKSAAAEWSNGLLNTLELHFAGLTFDQFLQHASTYNERGKQMEAAVLASAVLEDTVKRLCRKHNIATDDKTLDSLINALRSNRIVGKVKAERLKAYAALRNQAFHAEWGAFDDRDLRQMIEGLEELLDTHFGAANLEQ